LVKKFDLNKIHAAAVKKAVAPKINTMVEALKLATPVDTGEAREGWRYEDGKIINDVAHIVELNEGSSKQAPTNFIEMSLLSHEGVRPSGIIVRSQ
jgi:hypothetical protein